MMQRGTLFIVLAFLLHSLSAQVTTSLFNAPEPYLKIGAFDPERNVAYFLTDNTPTTVRTVAYTADGPVSTVLAGTLSVGRPLSAMYFSLAQNLVVAGSAGVAAYNTQTARQTAFSPTPRPLAAFSARITGGRTSEGLVFAVDVPLPGTPPTVYLWDLRSFQLLDTIPLLSSDGNVTLILHDVPRNTLLLGTDVAPNGRLVVVTYTGRKLTRTGHQELPVNLNTFTAGYVDELRGVAYVAIANPRSQILKYDLASLTRTHVFDAPGTPQFYAVVDGNTRGYSYWFTLNAQMYRFESCGFTLVDRTTLPNQPVGFAQGTEQYLSVAQTPGAPGQMIRLVVNGGVNCVDTAQFRRVTSRKDSCLVDVRAGVTDPVNNVGYFVTNTPHANILAFDLSSSNIPVSKIFKLDGGYGRSLAIDVQRRKLFVGLNEPSAGQIVKLDISSDLRVLGSKAIIHGARSMVLDQANNILYACTNPRGVGRGYGVVHKINAETLDIISTLNLTPQDDGCNVLLLDSMRGSLYVGTASYPARIVKINTNPFARETEIQLNSQLNQTTTGFIDSGSKFAYFGFWGPAGAIIKVNIDTFTLVDIFSAPGLPGFTTSVDDPTHGVSYWITSDVPASVHRIRTCDFSYIDSFKLRRNEEVPFAALFSAKAGLVFSTGRRVPSLELSSGVCGSLVQLHVSRCIDCPVVPDRLTRVASSFELATTGKDTRAGVVDPLTGVAYFVTYTAPAVVLRVGVNPSLGVSNRLVLTNNLGKAAAVDGSRQKGFFGMASSPGAVVKVDLASFSVENVVSTRYSVRALAYDAFEGVLYAGTKAPAGFSSLVYKINALTLEIIGIVELDVADAGASTIQLDRKRGYLYVGTTSSPARIVRLKMSRFDRINYIELPFGYNVIGTSLLDNDEDRAIFSVSQPYARLVSFGFDGFKWQETLNYPGVKAFSAAVADPITGYSYWFTDEVPSTVHRVKMCNFEKGDTFPLREADEVPRAAVYSSGKITVGTSCVLANPDNTCGVDHKLSFFQLQGGAKAVCSFANPAPAPTVNIINSTLVSLRFNFKGMLPPAKFCPAQ